MSIQTTKTNAHMQRMAPKPLRKGGLHSIEDTGAVYAHAYTGQYAGSTPQPLDRHRVAEQRTRAELQASHGAGMRPIRNSTVNHKKNPYVCTELAPSVRPGAMDAKALPSGGYAEQAQRAAAESKAASAAGGQFVPIRMRK
ncbi:MAG: hypothetical protein ACTS8S_11075 [Giesbergeria sp.]